MRIRSHFQREEVIQSTSSLRLCGPDSQWMAKKCEGGYEELEKITTKLISEKDEVSRKKQHLVEEYVGKC